MERNGAFFKTENRNRSFPRMTVEIIKMRLGLPAGSGYDPRAGITGFVWGKTKLFGISRIFRDFIS